MFPKSRATFREHALENAAARMGAAGTHRRYPARPLLAVSAAVWRDDTVLLTRRGGAPAKGLWSLPGGLVRIGETLGAAVARELAEEAGIQAALERIADWAEVVSRDGAGRVEHHYVIAMFTGRWCAGEPVAGDDADAAGWFGLDQMDALSMTPGTAERIRRVAPW